MLLSDRRFHLTIDISHRGLEDNFDVIGEANGRENDSLSAVSDGASIQPGVQLLIFRDGSITNEGVPKVLVFGHPDDIII